MKLISKSANSAVFVRVIYNNCSLLLHSRQEYQVISENKNTLQIDIECQHEHIFEQVETLIRCFDMEKYVELVDCDGLEQLHESPERAMKS